jgi:crotonobetainyl-CoA:carnitine CoA-transferase CaiB-like acyl-CoA transferase
MLTEMQAAQFTVPLPPARPIYGPIETADGFVMLALGSERIFQNMAAAAGHGDWLADPRFADYANRRGHWGELMDEIET